MASSERSQLKNGRPQASSRRVKRRRHPPRPPATAISVEGRRRRHRRRQGCHPPSEALCRAQDKCPEAEKTASGRRNIVAPSRPLQ
ncbi:hypothetical protein MRX96_056147 [Rhipicephalus microplus]